LEGSTPPYIAPLEGVEVGVMGLDDKAEKAEEVPEWLTAGREACSFRTALHQMLMKRALVASRDLKALAHMILLPTLVVAFVLLILKMQFSPAGPELSLDASLYKGDLQVEHHMFAGWGVKTKMKADKRTQVPNIPKHS
jgi:hypothetical protein